MLLRFVCAFFISLILLGCVNNSASTKVNEVVGNDVTLIVESSDTTQYITLLERNLGVINEGETVVGEIKLSTLLPEIHLFEVKGTCGCMTLNDYSLSMKRDEVKSLKYTITTTGKSGEEYFDIIINSSVGKYIIEMRANIRN